LIALQFSLLIHLFGVPLSLGSFVRLLISTDSFVWFDLTWFFSLDGSLFDWLIVMVFADLSTMITHCGCCSLFVELTVDLVYFSGLICNKLKAY